MLDTYLSGLPRNRRGVGSYIEGIFSRPKTEKREKPSPEPEPVSEVDEVDMPDFPEEEELEHAPYIEARGKRGLLNKVKGFFEGLVSPTSIRGGEGDHLGGMEVVDLPELEEDDFVDEPRPEGRSWFGSLMDRLMGVPEEEGLTAQEEEDARVTKLVLYKDRTEKEVRFLLKLIDNLYPRIYKRTRDEFEKSPDFRIYQKIRERYVVDEEEE